MIFSGWESLDMIANARTCDGEMMGRDRQSPDWDYGIGEVVHYAKVQAGENVGDIPDDQPGARIMEGFLFEQIIEYVMAGMGFDEAANLAFKRYMMHQLRTGVVKQVRLVKDRLRGTPDGDNPAAEELESCKATRRTLRNARTGEDFEANFWTWLMSDKAYLHMAGRRRVRYFVWWLAGDYSKGKGTGPQMLTATCEFTEDELVKNWNDVLAFKARIDAESGRQTSSSHATVEVTK